MTPMQRTTASALATTTPVAMPAEVIEIAARRVGEMLNEENTAALSVLLREFDPRLVISFARAAINISNVVREDLIVTRPAKVRETPVLTRAGFTRQPNDIFFHLMRQHCVHEGIKWQTLRLPHAQGGRVRRSNG